MRRVTIKTSRLEAFSDGVMAIVITITVLGIHMPKDTSFSSIIDILPMFAIYTWSFRTIATYWNNHHHLFDATPSINSRIMWVNMHFLFWLSLIPFVTEWLGHNFGKALPTAVYSFILLWTAVAYTLIEKAIVHHHGSKSKFAKALGSDIKGKLSLGCYILAIIISFIIPLISYILIIAVAVIWFIPDKRISKIRKKKLQN